MPEIEVTPTYISLLLTHSRNVEDYSAIHVSKKKKFENAQNILQIQIEISLAA